VFANANALWILAPTGASATVLGGGGENLLSVWLFPIDRRGAVAMALDAPPPPPYLDVLTVHSRRLLSKTRAEIAAKERARDALRSDALASGAQGDDLAALAASVRLLLEPVQLPDLGHTGLATVAAASGKLPQGEDVLLFYPTGAKNANMREFVRETLDKHQLLRGAASTADLPNMEASSSPPLAASASTPVIVSATAKAKAKRKKRKPAAVTRSPVKAAMSPSARLDRELTRQARDVLAALRANSSKINELIAK
jgi:hypothetical protein